MTEIHLQTNECERHELYDHEVVKCLLPVHDDILVVTRNSFKLLSLNRDVYHLDSKERFNITPSPMGTPSYMFLSDYLVELHESNVRLSYKSREKSIFTAGIRMS